MISVTSGVEMGTVAATCAMGIVSATGAMGIMTGDQTEAKIMKESARVQEDRVIVETLDHGVIEVEIRLDNVGVEQVVVHESNMPSQTMSFEVAASTNQNVTETVTSNREHDDNDVAEPSLVGEPKASDVEIVIAHRNTTSEWEKVPA